MLYFFQQLKKQGYFSVNIVGTGQGLRLTLNIEADEYMAGPLSGSGAMVLLHDPDEAPRMRDLAYAVSPGSHTLLAVKYRMVRIFGKKFSIITQIVTSMFLSKIKV